jgi:hypothetical protein
MIGVHVEVKQADAGRAAERVGKTIHHAPVLPLADVGDALQNRAGHGPPIIEQRGARGLVTLTPLEAAPILCE